TAGAEAGTGSSASAGTASADPAREQAAAATQSADEKTPADAAPPTDATAGPHPSGDSLPARIADLTQDFVQSVSDDVMTAVAMFRSAGSGDPVRGVSTEVWL